MNSKIMRHGSILLVAISSLFFAGCKTVQYRTYSGPEQSPDQIAHIRKASPHFLYFKFDQPNVLAIDGNLAPKGKLGYASNMLYSDYDLLILPGPHLVSVRNSLFNSIDDNTDIQLNVQKKHTYVLDSIGNRWTGIGWFFVYDETEKHWLQLDQDTHFVKSENAQVKRWNDVNWSEIKKDTPMTKEQALAVVRRSLLSFERVLKQFGPTKKCEFSLDRFDESGFTFRMKIPRAVNGVVIPAEIQQRIDFDAVTKLSMPHPGITNHASRRVTLWSKGKHLIELPLFIQPEKITLFGWIYKIKDEDLLIALSTLCKNLSPEKDSTPPPHH